MKPNLNSKFINATKWSTISEVIAKLAAPISSMALARLLAPEAFGVVATLNMVIAFAEIFTDAGFQRYLIQHEFVDEDDKTQKPSTKDAVVRIINLSPELGVIDVKFNGVAYADDIEYRDETEYTYLPIGKYVVAVEDGNNVNQFAQGNYEFKANRIYTIYIVGNKPNIEIIQSVDGNTYACM